jgi:hypothetical protein
MQEELTFQSILPLACYIGATVMGEYFLSAIWSSGPFDLLLLPLGLAAFFLFTTVLEACYRPAEDFQNRIARNL